MKIEVYTSTANSGSWIAIDDVFTYVKYNNGGNWIRCFRERTIPKYANVKYVRTISEAELMLELL